MNGKDLLAGMGHIDEKYVDEGERGTIRRKQLPVGWLSLAACLCIIVCAALLLPDFSIYSASTNDCAMEAVQETEAVEFEEYYSDQNAEAEVPSLTVRIEVWEEGGFIAAAVQSEDTDLIPPGTEVIVRFSESIGIEIPQGNAVTYESRTPTEAEFPAGTLVTVRFVSWEETDTGFTIVIESIAALP